LLAPAGLSWIQGKGYGMSSTMVEHKDRLPNSLFTIPQGTLVLLIACAATLGIERVERLAAIGMLLLVMGVLCTGQEFEFSNRMLNEPRSEISPHRLRYC
jgi:hypothetical protein